MYLHKTKNGHYTPPCCYFSGELEVVECLPQTFSGGMMVCSRICTPLRGEQQATFLRGADLPDTGRWHPDAVVRGQWFLQWSGKSGALWFRFHLADWALAYAGIYPLRKRQKCNKTFRAAQVLSLRGSFYFIPNRRSQDSANIGLLMHFWKDKYPFKIWMYDKINQHKF